MIPSVDFAQRWRPLPVTLSGVIGAPCWAVDRRKDKGWSTLWVAFLASVLTQVYVAPATLELHPCYPVSYNDAWASSLLSLSLKAALHRPDRQPLERTSGPPSWRGELVDHVSQDTNRNMFGPPARTQGAFLRIDAGHRLTPLRSISLCRPLTGVVTVSGNR